MEILVLGGTAFLSRAGAEQARDRGHAVTCLARGTTPTPDGVGFVAGDRDQEDALSPVADRRWDAVVDIASQPGRVRRAVRELTTAHWVYVSSVNAYRAFDSPDINETTPLHDPLEGDVMESMEQYGAAKVACEEAIRGSGTTATVVRAGLIGGYGDWSGRSGYYPWRFANPTGPDVLVPDDPEFRCALIDVADMAAWIVHAAEQRIDGAFNATGPAITLGEVLAAARRAAGPGAPPARPVPADVLAEAGVSAWMGPASLPLWIDDPAERFFATMDTSKARAAGLTTRPLDETLAAALAYERVRGDVPRQTGLSDEEEMALRSRLDG
jgi:nucleoside-diphosphate-sugar epimerase